MTLAFPSASMAGRRLARHRALLAAAGLAILLTGCKSDSLTTGTLPSDGYRTLYPIVVMEAEEVLDIPVGSGSAGLSRLSRDNIRALGADAARNATTTVVILSPVGSGNQAAANAIAGMARREVEAAGVPGRFIEMRRYQVEDATAMAPVRLAYGRIKAVSPPCGQWNEQLYGDYGNGPGTELGCATQANLAAMIADPENLINPEVPTAASGSRRTYQLIKWAQSGDTRTEVELEIQKAEGG